MNKPYFFFVLLLGFSLHAKADHITGGEIYYTYSIGANGQYIYNCTFKLFMRCFSTRHFNNPTIISIFDKGTNRRISDVSVNLLSSETISITDNNPCITNPPQVCYVVGYYNFTVSLPASVNGYILASQVNYRIAGIDNLQPNYNNVGATYTAEIPGTAVEPTGVKNNSAHFVGSDLVVVCANNRFAYSFAASDNDGDQLRYSFCSAYRSGSSGNMVVPPPQPPYSTLPYGNNFSGGVPLGLNVQINSATGLITGTAPAAGIYVVTVCVEEIRNGVVIATQRKDLQINIASCDIAAAQLQPDYMLCGDTKTLSLANQSVSSLIHSQKWVLTNRSGATIFTSADKILTYTFADTGSYIIRLTINSVEACSDSTTSIVRVYPGFVPGFSYRGVCYNKPTFFTDETTTVYGLVNKWDWDFGNGEFSTEQNPNITYTQAATRNVQLVVENTVGCRDTLVKPIRIDSAPPINLAFTDTLICIGDPLTLSASGNGNFTWTPDIYTINSNSPEPTVTPATTTTYTVRLDDDGCINTASVLVRVTDHVSLQTMSDTTICSGDTIQLIVSSDALKYSWLPASQLIDSSAASPFAITGNTTIYSLTANIGSCTNEAQIKVSTVPYPYAYAGEDTMICFRTSAFLSGVTDGKTVQWSPAFSLNDPNILHPVASPAVSTSYLLFAFDTKGCPKKGSDTVFVKVLPAIVPFSGQDTAVVVNQPLQLAASGGTAYLWEPANNLSNPHIPNPVARYNEPSTGILYKTLIFNEAGCVDSSFITIKVFIEGPSIYIPTAFTPNADGKNDVIRPIAAGIKEIQGFFIYNRWGQLVFKTSVNGKGWDGTISGVPQATGVYVWMVKAVDYNGAPYFKKGTVTLIK